MSDEDPPPLLSVVYNLSSEYNTFLEKCSLLEGQSPYFPESDYSQKPYTGHESEEDEDDE